MTILGRLHSMFNSRRSLEKETNQKYLEPFEIRLIAEGNLEKLVDLAVSVRLNLVDPKGNTPLHLAAMKGNLAVCDLFIRSGADPNARNQEQLTPADIAHAEGHKLTSRLLSPVGTNSPKIENREAHKDCTMHETTADMVQATRPVEHPSLEIASAEVTPIPMDELDDLLSFEAVAEPEEFFGESTNETSMGKFVKLVSSTPSVFNQDDGDWDLDLSPTSIIGDGIGSAIIAVDRGAEHDFLKVRKRGRQSVKRTIVQTGTRLSIDPELCTTWSEETLVKGWCSSRDIESLIALCEGNGDFKELHINLLRNIEDAGLDIVDQTSKQDGGLWDARSVICAHELAEVIEATLNRSTRLPGTQLFVMDKSDELHLLDPMVRAKQELQLRILASEAAVQKILDIFDDILVGIRDPISVSLKTISPTRPGHTETAEVMSAAADLKNWQTNGRVMDGKRRREALAALEALDLSLAFHKELVRSLGEKQESSEHAIWLDTQISVFEAANERLIHEHLPYVRRFSARNVGEGEDPEDVFQVAFMGLQRSTRRFDPERGYRFVVYASYWMRQAIVRWRADEGAAIRIPVHRKEKIARLDLAMEKLDVRADGTVSDNDLAVDLEWTTDEVIQFRAIPREAEYPESIDDWDEVLPEQEDANAFDQTETERIITDALAELPEREADIIRMRFGIDRDSDMTLEEIGQIYGVTRERIRQIEAKGLDRLSHPGRKRRLQELLGI